MATDMRLILAIILCLILSACSPRFTDRSEYRLDDVVYRKMRLTFYKDGRLILVNSATSWIGYSNSGKWNLKNDKMLIWIDHSNCNDTITVVEYPKQGDTVNLERLFVDPRYSTFPVIITDTVRFSDNFKIAYLKGFIFEHHPSTARLKRIINNNKNKKAEQ